MAAIPRAASDEDAIGQSPGETSAAYAPVSARPDDCAEEEGLEIRDAGEPEMARRDSNEASEDPLLTAQRYC